MSMGSNSCSSSKSSNSCSSSQSRMAPEIQQRIFQHEIHALIQTSHTIRNPERRYAYCQRRAWDDCGFWEWIDPKLTTYYKVCFLIMKFERDKVLEQLHSRSLMGDMKYDRVGDSVELKAFDEACADVVELKALTKEMEMNLKRMELRIKMMYFAFGFIGVMLLVVKYV